jgi:plexin A
MFIIAGTGTRMSVGPFVREDYPINYVHGFSSEGFSYFLTTRMRRTIPSPFIPKLVRVCHDDENYDSYTEIPIDCISEGAKRYNLVQAAYVGKPGSDLAADLSITAQDDVLFAVFSESDQSEGEVSSKPGSNSALCVYSLKAIRRKFMQNIKTCFSGVGWRGLGYIGVCKRMDLAIGEDFCGHEVNSPLGGEQPIAAVPVLVYGSHLTDVAATSTGDYTVVFLGTANVQSEGAGMHRVQDVLGLCGC